MPDQPTAAVLIIGNEILSGRTRDSNLPYIAEKLSAMGIALREARVVADREEAIMEAVNACRAAYTYVFTTGGIGPTHDDITSRSVAAALGVPVTRNKQAVARLERQYVAGGLNAARLKMADLPDGATLIDNPVSGAPGFQIENVYVLAGVPDIMKAMFDGLNLTGGPPILTRAISCFVTEGGIAGDLAKIQDRFPEADIGSYPFFRSGSFGTTLVIRGTDGETVEAAAAAIRTLIESYGAEPIEQGP